MVDTLVLGTSGESREGSSPFFPTKNKKFLTIKKIFVYCKRIKFVDITEITARK